MNGRRLVGWNLRRIRVAKGLSQEKLAADAEVDRAYVGRLERATENPTISVLERLAAALSVKLVDLFAEPRPGAGPPKTLRAGRKAQKPKSAGEKSRR
jgi:transcriptional regulator with XRE-family HTH domain